MKTTATNSVSINPQRSIGDFIAQITIEEQHSDELEITDHPVESGASISDHAFKKPMRVQITAASSATQVDIDAAYKKLLELQEKREPFSVITGKRSYKEMLIESLKVTTDAAKENVLWFSATCKEIRRVSIGKTSLPPIEDQQIPWKTAETQDVGSMNLKSVDESFAYGVDEITGGLIGGLFGGFSK